MGLVRAEVYEMQSGWYAAVSQAYGVPLDSRGQLTKSDWALWAAAGASAATRRLVVDSVACWLNETAAAHPFADLYMTTGRGDYPPGAAFKARPVAGGHFSLLALARTGQRAAATGADTAGSRFPRNGTLALAPDDGESPAGVLPLPPRAPAPPPRAVERLASAGRGWRAD